MRTQDASTATRLCCLSETDDDTARNRLEVPHLASQALSVFYGGRKAVDQITLAFPKNRITAIVGPSGAGKSSYLHCLNRLSDAIPGCTTTGEVCFAGTSIYAPQLDVIGLRLRIGMIFQKPTPFPLTIRENVAIGLREHSRLDRRSIEERVVAALEKVGLWKEVADRLDSAALGLSGGQQQRLCLARALALEPQVLLLDEPCSALDPISTAVIEDLIKTLKASTTIVIVTHNLAQAQRLADKVALFWVQDGMGYLEASGRATDIFNGSVSAIAHNYVHGRAG